MKRMHTVYIALFVFVLAIPQRLVSQSLNFDGDQDYVNVNTVAGEMSGATDWAVSFWVKPNLANFPERALSAVRDMRCRYSRSIPAIFRVNILDNLFSTFVLKIHINVRRFIPFRAYEPLKQKINFHI